MKQDEEVGTSGLPDGWAVAMLAKVAEVRLGKMLSPKAQEAGLIRLPYLRNENVRWGHVDSSDLKDMGFRSEEIERYSVRAGDLLVCEGGEPGRCAIFKGADGTMMFQKALHRVRPYSNLVNTSYLQYWLTHVVKSKVLMPRFSETTIQHLPLEKMEALRVTLPPAAEQARIIAEIDRLFSLLDAGVANLKRVRANLKRYRASVLQAACTGKLVPTEHELCFLPSPPLPPSPASLGEGGRGGEGKNEAREGAPTGYQEGKGKQESKPYEPATTLLTRILTERRARWEADQLAKMQAAGKEPKDDKWKAKYEEPIAPDKSNLPTLPTSWAWVKVDQVATITIGFAFKSEQFSKTGIRLLRGENLEPGSLRWNDTRFWSEGNVDAYVRYLLDEGDIVLAMDRPVVSAGLKIARVKATDLPCLLVQRMARFGPASGIDTKYLYAVLQTADFIQHLSMGQTGSQLPHISGGGIGSYIFALPPVAEQERIVAEVERRLSVVDALETTVAHNLKRAERLRQAILRDAFAGKLVPQDPSDEPASVLLARIEAERVATTKPVPAKKATRKKLAIEQETLTLEDQINV